VSIQDLRPGPQDDSSSFSPPTYAIWVNSLWISSLIISITSALLATLIQQWTRRYVRLTEPLGCAHKQARLRQHIYNGVGNLHFLLVTDAVPTLLHLSVFLFFAGLLVLLWHINHAVFNAVVGWVLLCVVTYAYITFLPIHQPDSPHFAPISSLAWQFYAEILYPIFEYLFPFKRGICIRPPATRLLQRVEEKAEEVVLNKSPELDAVILDSLLSTLGEDGAREKFFDAIPGFYESKVVNVEAVNNNLRRSPTFFTNFRRTVDQFLDQTLSSDSVSESVRSRRLLSCLNATQSVLGELAGASITDKIIRSGNWNEMPPSPETGNILRRWRNTTGLSRALIGSCIIARIIATVEKRDNTWMMLARSQLGVNEEVLGCYLEHGDSVLLANLIKITRLFFEKGLQFQGILRSISEIDVKMTLPELRHDFCMLWNEMVEKSEQCGDCIFILDEICHVHAALHPTVPTSTAAPPTVANNGSPLLESSHALCVDTQSHHPHPPNTSRQFSAVASSESSPSSPLGVRPPLSRLRELPLEIRHGYSSSTATSYMPPTPRDVSVSYPGVIVVSDEHDIHDLNAYDQHQSHPPAPDISMSASRPGKSDV
jgi:hypothetical protein